MYNNNRLLVDAYGSFLSEFVWDWFCTFTFRESPHPEKASKAFRHFVHVLNRSLYGQRYRKAGASVRWCLALEYHKTGIIHYHALLGDNHSIDRRVSRRWAENEWNRIAGFASIRPIDDQVSAVTNYVAKYVGKGGQIDLSPDLIRRVDLNGIDGPHCSALARA